MGGDKRFSRLARMLSVEELAAGSIEAPNFLLIFNMLEPAEGDEARVAPVESEATSLLDIEFIMFRIFFLLLLLLLLLLVLELADLA